MKIALVNLATISDYSKRDSYQDDISFLNENHIDYVDYCSGRSGFQSLLDGFHEALRNPEIDLVWFVQGGFTVIKFLRHIDWDLVATTKKKYMGSSDFTHFSYKAVPLECECYYGLTLSNITKYHPTKDDKEKIIDFLTTGIQQPYTIDLLDTEEQININTESVIGGHVIISTFMLSQEKINLQNKFLFLEHHNIPGEGYPEIEFYLDQLLYIITDNQPKGFVLGHSFLYDESGATIDYKIINTFIVEKLSVLSKPIVQIDHFKNIIKFS